MLNIKEANITENHQQVPSSECTDPRLGRPRYLAGWTVR